MTLPIAFALAACIAVTPDADRILARDLVSAFPPLLAVAPDTEIGAAPAPGVTRLFRPLDLRLLTARFHLDTPPDTEPFCVTRPVALLDAAHLLAAMQQSLPGARIEVLDFSRQPSPQGDLVFPLSGLHPMLGNAESASPPALWNGWVRYGGSRRFIVWAKVHVSVTARHVLAVADLRPGQPIAAAQVNSESADHFPSTTPFAQSVEQVAGRWPRSTIRAGSAIRTDQLEEPREVMRGEAVRVEVTDGAAHLVLDAIAQASGAIGETIPVLNPETKKRFRARVEGKGRVSVDASSSLPGGKS